MLKEPIHGVVIGGLPFLSWEQFQVVRYALQQSHQRGRHPATKFCGEDGPPVSSHPGEWPVWCTREKLNVVSPDIEDLMMQSWERDKMYQQLNNDDDVGWKIVSRKRNRYRTKTFQSD